MQVFQTALAAIYPPRCLGCGDLVSQDFGLCSECWADTRFTGGARCDTCASPLPGADPDPDLRCDACISDPKPWDRGRAALLYHGVGRQLVLRLKHGDRQDIADPASRWMTMASRDLLTDEMLIAPVPLHWTRLARRRYNQSALLAQALAHRNGIECCPDLLVRTRRTPSLDGKSREERADIVHRAIAVHPRRRHKIAGRPVLIVDDVMTSGATLGACAEACRAAGAGPVCVSVLARVAKDT